LILRGEAFLIFSLIISIMILFYGAYTCTLTPGRTQFPEIEFLYLHVLNNLLDKYFQGILRHYPLNSMFINSSICNLADVLFKYRSIVGVDEFHFSTISNFKYNSTDSQIYCFCRFMIRVGSISLTRSLSYNLSLHVLDCWVNASQITLKYLFIENGRIVHPSHMVFYVLMNSSWVNVPDYSECSEGYVKLYVEGNGYPSMVLLDFTSSMGVRITALISIRH
jgi:hypothetical protein